MAVFLPSNNLALIQAVRTPHGAFLGSLSDFSATDLASMLVKSAAQSWAKSDLAVQHLFFGCVLTAGIGQAPARQVVLKSDLTQSVGATHVSRVCGSGMEALTLGCLMLDRAENTNQVMVALGAESMSRAPYLMNRLDKKAGHRRLVDHLFLDGLEDQKSGLSMGLFAEDLAVREGAARATLDAYAINSAGRALEADRSGCFDAQIVPVYTKKTQVVKDEPLQKVNLEKIPALRPAFKAEGVLTAANSSSLADGASFLSVMLEDAAKKKGKKVQARIRGWSSFSADPKDFITAPAHAADALLKALEWSEKSVDVWEVNEAFALVPLLFQRHFSLTDARLNPWGGALSLGHPLGASGARIIVNLAHLLEARQEKRGIAAICVGGGEGLAVALER